MPKQRGKLSKERTLQKLVKEVGILHQLQVRGATSATCMHIAARAHSPLPGEYECAFAWLPQLWHSPASLPPHLFLNPACACNPPGLPKRRAAAGML